MHDCTKIIEKVYLVLDGELTIEEETSFMHEIDQCSYCLEKFNIEKSFKMFMANKMERKNGSAHLIAAIKEKIKSNTF